MKTVTLQEHQNATVGDGPQDTLTERDVAALEQAQRAMNVSALSWSGRNTVKAAEQVGILAAGNVRLEILPKIVGLGRDDTRSVLVRMIAIASDVPVHDGEITTLDCQNRDLLELLIGLFAQRLVVQVRAGLSRSYQQRSDDLSRLRGKLDVQQQFTRLAATPQKLSCRYDEFTADTMLNRLLLCAVITLWRRSTRTDTQRLLAEIAGHFEDVALVDAEEALRPPLLLTGPEKRWKTPELLARLILSVIYQTTHAGERDGIALLFNMNRLFESYVSELTRQASTRLGYAFHSQGPWRCLARSAKQQGLFQTRPDVHLHRGGDVVVLDAKWKRLSEVCEPFGISPEDAYQMHAYAHIYGTSAVVIVYPHQGSAGVAGLKGDWMFVSGKSAFQLVTIDLTNSASFVETLGQLLQLNEQRLQSPEGACP